MTERLDSRALHHILEERASARATFIEWAGESYSYRSLVDDVRKCCALFDIRGLAPGGRILILTWNERIAISAFVAALLDGHVPIMLTPETPNSRAKAIAELTKPALVVVDRFSLAGQDWIPPERVIAVSAAPRRSDGILDRLWRAGPANSSFDDLLRTFGGRQPRCNSKPDDLAYVLFTSGTTSAPKGVMVTHRNLFAHLETLSRVFAYNNTSAIFNGMVLAHGDGLVQGPLLALANGCSLIRPPAFLVQTLEQHLNLVRAKRATHFITVPTIYGFIDRYALHDDYFEAEELVALISVSAKLEDQLWRRLEGRFGRPVYNMYGLTETVASALYAGPGTDLGPIGTIGKPIDIDIRLVSPDGTPANEGEAGEIWLRGENVSPGYFAGSTATAEKYEGGWLKTGDRAIRRADGAYEIRGRIKTIIICGGFLINPEEIDEVLMSHPAVVEAASVGLQDNDFGEIAVSAVVLDKAADEFELTEYCSRFLEPRKIPKRVCVVRSIPRGDAKKPQLEQLRTLLAASIRQEGAAPVSSDLAEVILNIASQTFRIPATFLSLDSSPRTVARWDSFAHINLILNVENHLQKRIATADAFRIDSLRKLLEVVSRTS
jgi:long-chain acyl-CoA synthetase